MRVAIAVASSVMLAVILFGGASTNMFATTTAHASSMVFYQMPGAPVHSGVSSSFRYAPSMPVAQPTRNVQPIPAAERSRAWSPSAMFAVVGAVTGGVAALALQGRSRRAAAPRSHPVVAAEERRMSRPVGEEAMVQRWAAAAVLSLALAFGPAPSALALPPGKMKVSLDELTQIVSQDFTERRYLVTGDLTPGVYADDAHFADSNNDFGKGTRTWQRGVKALFVSDRCKLALTKPVVADAEKRTIVFTGWRQVDVFRLPGAPHTPVFTGTTTLTLDPVDNLVIDHTEVWDQSPEEIKAGFTFFDPKFDPPGFEKTGL